SPRSRNPRISGGRARRSVPSPRLEPPIASWALSPARGRRCSFRE
ncbi:hypothetical protein A2U01_0065411, partial [Trifolium medium]|nr:hypothetical protein [Trifolium medium]